MAASLFESTICESTLSYLHMFFYKNIEMLINV